MITNRTAAICGILFAVLFLAGFMLATAQTVTLSDGDAQVLADWDNANFGLAFAGVYILAASVLAFALFLSHLRARFVAREPASELARAGFLLGVVAIVVMLSALAGAGSLSFASTFNTDFKPTADTIRAIDALSFTFFVIGGGLVMALAVGLLSWEMRTALAPWVGWLGLVCALALLFSVFVLPMIALPIWAIATSIALLRSKEPAAD